MTELERLEVALRSIRVDDTWTPTELLDAIIAEITRRNVHEFYGSRNKSPPPKRPK